MSGYVTYNRCAKILRSINICLARNESRENEHDVTYRKTRALLSEISFRLIESKGWKREKEKKWRKENAAFSGSVTMDVN